MLRKRLSLALGAALALAAGPLAALGSNIYYVPVIAEDGGETIQIVVSNLDESTSRNFRTFFLPLNRSGVEPRDESAFQQFSVGPERTIVIEQGADVPGVVEITAAAPLSISAQRLPFPGSRLSAEIPVVSAANTVKAGSPMTLQGWVRSTSGMESNLGLMNLAESQMECDARIFDAGGQQLLTGALLRLAPLSVAHFPDALSLFTQSVNNARVVLECDQEAFAWSEVIDRKDNLITFRRPSVGGLTTFSGGGDNGGGGGDDGGGGGGGDDGGGGSGDGNTVVQPDGTVIFTVDGTVAKPVRGREMWLYNIPAEPNKIYTRVEVEFDVYDGGPNLAPGGTIMSLFWLNRGSANLTTNVWTAWKNNVVAFANDIIGKNEIKFLTNLEEQSARIVFNGGATMNPGNWYTVRYVRDTSNGRNDITITDANGNQVGAIRGSTRNKKLRTDESGFYYIEFGHHGPPYYGPERESLGWEWRDLKVTFTP